MFVDILVLAGEHYAVKVFRGNEWRVFSSLIWGAQWRQFGLNASTYHLLHWPEYSWVVISISQLICSVNNDACLCGKVCLWIVWNVHVRSAWFSISVALTFSGMELNNWIKRGSLPCVAYVLSISLGINYFVLAYAVQRRVNLIKDGVNLCVLRIV